VLFHEDGGGINETAARYGIGFRDDVVAAIDALRGEYASLRSRVLEQAPSGDAMCARYRRAIQRLLTEEAATTPPPR
jgi:hypothetical protein